MQIKVSIKRQKSADQNSYVETYLYQGDGMLTVADYLTELNRDPNRKTIEGHASSPILWECSCLEKRCGACAMVINRLPQLACGVFLQEAGKNGTLTIEPLSKFPVISDLKVDRSTIFEVLKKMEIYTEEKSGSEYDWDKKAQYLAGQCLMCGCCLEACPNFLSDGLFGGGAAMVQAYKALEQEERGGHLKRMRKQYRTYFQNGCGMSLSCKKVCPIKLPLDDIQARANAAAR